MAILSGAMNMLIALGLVMLIGCAGRYPPPEPGTYFIRVDMVEGQAAIQEVCEPPAGETWAACARQRGRWMALNTEDWWLTIAHEMGHILGVNEHD